MPDLRTATLRTVRRTDSVLFTALIVVVIVAMATVSDFADVLTVNFLLVQIIPVLLIAMPMTLIIVTGEIDLSVASIVGVTSAVMGVMWRDHGHHMGITIVVCLLVGLVCGLLNGFLIAVAGLPSLAVTIGTLALFRGLALVVIGDGKVSDFPYSWTSGTTDGIGGTGIPQVMIPVLIVVGLFAVLLHATAFGRSLFAMGFSPEAATFAGIRVARSKFLLYALSGLVSGVVGVYWTLQFSSAGSDNATGLELDVIAAVLLGGVSIFGGRGTIFGAMTGVLLIGTITYALRLAYVPDTSLKIVTGMLLIVSVVTPRALEAIQDRRRKIQTSSDITAVPTAV